VGLEAFAGGEVAVQLTEHFTVLLAAQEFSDQLRKLLLFNWDDDLVDIVGANADHGWNCGVEYFWKFLVSF
jgi:hypothetical protein